jgi:imidazolonepropionase-like amidohydrolase
VKIIKTPKKRKRIMNTQQTKHAITSVSIIDVTGGPTQTDMTVIIDNDSIKTIGKTDKIKIPENYKEFDASGKYLIPGLWDMHVHAMHNERDKSFFPLFAANGVVGIREMGTYLSASLYFQETWDSNSLNPRVIWGSPMLDGSNPASPHGLGIQFPGAARSLVHAMKKLGFEFLKIYDRMSSEVYHAVIDEARKIGLSTGGHVPYSISAGEASRAGQNSIEHMSLVVESCIPGALDKVKRQFSDFDKPQGIGGPSRDWLTDDALNSFDPKLFDDLCNEFIKNNTWHTPTLTWSQGTYLGYNEECLKNQSLEYAIPKIRQDWNNLRKTADTPDMRMGAKLAEKWMKIAGELHRRGVPILAGSDSSDEPGVIAGFSLHDELGFLVKVGLTPLEALQTATINPAKFLKTTNKYGTIEEGKVSDLVILNKNPLDNIKNTKDINAVVLRGKLINREKLDGLLQRAKTTVRQMRETQK